MKGWQLSRGAVVLLAGGLLATTAVPASRADSVRDAQWPLAAYRAESAIWPVSQGDGVTVAVVDTGVLKDHQDLTGQVLAGADFTGESTDGSVDTDGHGTGMASLIAGHGHGAGAGIMGLAPKAKILPIRITLGENPPSGRSEIAKAIRYAVDHGANVVNMSIGGPVGTDSEERAAVKYAVAKDVVMVAGTGNETSSVGYPAAFPGVVAVGAVDRNGQLWSKSNVGPETTLVAPGADIPRASAKSTSGQGIANGTSDATAYVSATAALIRAKYPQLSAGQVINRMIKSASAPGDGSAVPSNRYGYGVLAPAKALEANPAVDSGPRENPLLGRAESQGTVPPPTEEAWESPEAAAPVADGGNRGVRWVAVGAAGVAGVVAVGGVVAVLVVRGRRRRERAAAAAYQGYPPPRQG
ncbi:type VII secretion-associated serine protease mycosin [Kitasatospora purpeofusca]|uniref:type VII secretion-associated serine protease mycosin n=1 Tax=Kitasatospora purpeofusca TaxID=67352 RepID=UPI0022551369|nr:type VII secretion-associated serine protease mycosin [Kitasatospora purpeofusca]WSR32541.1 type VII secretion-associated serine protease mycosin [Kitasatospora purpeofusca]